MHGKREQGSGPKRIGTKLQHSEDLYSMFFVSTFRSEYIYHSKMSNEDPDALLFENEEQVR